MMVAEAETDAMFYTVPVSEVTDLSQLKTRKEALLSDSKDFNNTRIQDSLDLSFAWICQGKLPPQVFLLTFQSTCTYCAAILIK